MRSDPVSHRGPLSDPDRTVGSLLWRASRLPGAEYAPIAGLAWMLGVLFAIAELASVLPSPILIAGLAIAFAGAVALANVGNMSVEERCWRCERPKPVRANYCSDCGAELEESETVGSYLPAGVSDE